MRGFFFVVKNFENSQQLRDLQQIAHALAEASQLHRASSVARGRIQGDQRSKTAAIYKIDFLEVQDNVRVLGDQFLDRVPQSGRFFAEHNSTAAIDQHHAVHGSCAHSQLHKRYISRVLQ